MNVARYAILLGIRVPASGFENVSWITKNMESVALGLDLLKQTLQSVTLLRGYVGPHLMTQ